MPPLQARLNKGISLEPPKEYKPNSKLSCIYNCKKSAEKSQNILPRKTKIRGRNVNNNPLST